MRRKSISASAGPPTGLVMRGIVCERTKRMVPFENPKTEIVTYVITDENNHRYYIDDYAPNEYFSIDQNIEFSVYVRPYRKKNGDLSYNLCIQKDFHSTKGEHF